MNMRPWIVLSCALALGVGCATGETSEDPGPPLLESQSLDASSGPAEASVDPGRDAAADVADATARIVCDAGTACGSQCVDLQTSLTSCGACGNACAGGAAATCTAGACAATLRVRAFIDGRSDLVLSGSTVHWHHQSAAAPGLWSGNNEPTSLNNAPWTPVWPSAGENRDCNCDSQASPAVPPLPARSQVVGMQVVQSRGTVNIVQPTGMNNYTLTVTFDDGPSGASWYEVVLSYATQ